ncbi:fibronectin type III domain-containing protein [Salinibacterium sp. SWN1162]|uniref:fibronectin type III domain-containing protein n=1 Tax=Salinibacterium sp. SWN1162 TaxID=2792053 RepID=UPI0018CE328D|nr:fibronectin type III domain-containing protein [Salinibacterium sp. SWN1162]MBH0008744.1 fibronectin type III domain-containing protein [Salinibacterium sp. SWN1162]
MNHPVTAHPDAGGPSAMPRRRHALAPATQALIAAVSLVLLAVGILLVTSPAPLQTIDAKADYEEIALTWNPVANASKYTLQVASDPSMTTIVQSREVGTTNATLSELRNGTDYYIQVRALNGAGIGGVAPTPVLVSTPRREVAMPENVTSEAVSTTSVTVSWDPVEWATGYRITQLPSGGDARTIMGDGAATSLTIDDIPQKEIGLNYSYSVEAINGDLVSEPSASVQQNTQPTRPYGLAAVESSAAGATLEWVSSANAQLYRVDTSRTPDFSDDVKSFEIPAPLTRLSLNNVASDEAMYARVRSINGEETSSASAAVLITPENVPTLGVAVGSYNVLSIRYDASTNNPWSSRRTKIASNINAAKLDVVGLQEATTNTLSSKADATQLSDLLSLTKPALTASKAGFLGTRLLYNAKKYAPGKYGIITLPQLADDTTRAGIWQILKDRDTGTSFIVVNTHLTNGVGAEKDSIRLEQTQAIIDWLDNNYTDLPAVLTGDFNSYVGRALDTPISALTAAGYGAVEYSAAKSTNSDLSTLTEGDLNYGTSPKLDHIFASDTVSVPKYEIVDDSRYESGSDHRLVTSLLQIPQAR